MVGHMRAKICFVQKHHGCPFHAMYWCMKHTIPPVQSVISQKAVVIKVISPGQDQGLDYIRQLPLIKSLIPVYVSLSKDLVQL